MLKKIFLLLFISPLLSAEPINLFELLEYKLAGTAESPRWAIQFDKDGKVTNRLHWNISVTAKKEVYENKKNKVVIARRNDKSIDSIKVTDKKFFKKYKLNKDNSKIESITSCLKTEEGLSHCRTVNHTVCEKAKEVNKELEKMGKKCRSPIAKQQFPYKVFNSRRQVKAKKFALDQIKSKFKSLPEKNSEEWEGLDRYLSSKTMYLKDGFEKYAKSTKNNLYDCAMVVKKAIGGRVNYQTMKMVAQEMENIKGEGKLVNSKTQNLFSLLSDAKEVEKSRLGIKKKEYLYLPISQDLETLSHICVNSEFLEPFKSISPAQESKGQDQEGIDG